jgi:NitT/TauT family transport system substrate-binding protein
VGRVEGLTDVQYVDVPAGADPSAMVASGKLNFNYDFPPSHIAAIEAGLPITVLSGLHSGCLEVIANDSVRSIRDLKGRKVGVDKFLSLPHVQLSLMAAYVGLDPQRDIEWIEDGRTTAMELFARGDIDAFLAIPPEPQELRARKIGHTILNTTLDRPWSQHFCCLLASSADFASRNPIATKRVLRAILKSADFCVSQPELVAKQLVDDGFTDSYGFALQTLGEVRFDVWREFDPEDSMRFYALRMHEAGMIKSNPNKIIADGTDWRFVNELRRELKT